MAKLSFYHILSFFTIFMLLTTLMYLLEADKRWESNVIMTIVLGIITLILRSDKKIFNTLLFGKGYTEIAFLFVLTFSTGLINQIYIGADLKEGPYFLLVIFIIFILFLIKGEVDNYRYKFNIPVYYYISPVLEDRKWPDSRELQYLDNSFLNFFYGYCDDNLGDKSEFKQVEKILEIDLSPLMDLFDYDGDNRDIDKSYKNAIKLREFIQTILVKLKRMKDISSKINYATKRREKYFRHYFNNLDNKSSENLTQDLEEILDFLNWAISYDFEKVSVELHL